MIHLPQQCDSTDELSFPDLTALLDVIFILLVFLLLTANSVPKVLEVVLPAEDSSQSLPVQMNTPVTITLPAEPGVWGLDERRFSDWSAFEQALSQQLEGDADKQLTPDIIIAGDRQASLEKVLKLFAWLQVRDLNTAQFLMQSSSTESSVNPDNN